jgi:hypothetical protein
VVAAVVAGVLGTALPVVASAWAVVVTALILRPWRLMS